MIPGGGDWSGDRCHTLEHPTLKPLRLFLFCGIGNCGQCTQPQKYRTFMNTKSIIRKHTKLYTHLLSFPKQSETDKSKQKDNEYIFYVFFYENRRRLKTALSSVLLVHNFDRCLCLFVFAFESRYSPADSGYPEILGRGLNLHPPLNTLVASHRHVHFIFRPLLFESYTTNNYITMSINNWH